jgi:antitoxin PrlF
MVIAAKVSSKGQITLPKQIRKLLNVDTGSVVVFETKENNVFIKQAKTLSEFRGILKGKATPADSDKVRATAKKRVARRCGLDE